MCDECQSNEHFQEGIMSCSNHELMITSQFLLAIKCTITLIFGIHHRSVSIEPIISTFFGLLNLGSIQETPSQSADYL